MSEARRMKAMVLSPASAVQEDRLRVGILALEAFGYEVELAAHALTRGPLYFAGSPEERVADLMAAFADPSVDAIFAGRGGYGSNWLLEQIDWEKIARGPKKAFVGYSDLSFLLGELVERCGIRALHGPMVAADFARENGVHRASLKAALAGEAYEVGAAEGLRCLKPGSASGVLVGGCLSILVSLLGTKFEPKTEGKLLFLEDVGAKPYQVDRMLWQLRAAGKLEGVTGIVFGQMLDCVSPGAPGRLLEEAILSALDGFHGPIGIGLASGHVRGENVTLAMGARAEFEAGQESFLRISAGI